MKRIFSSIDVVISRPDKLPSLLKWAVALAIKGRQFFKPVTVPFIISPGKYKGAVLALHSLNWGIFLIITSGSQLIKIQNMGRDNKNLMTELLIFIGY